MTFEELLKASGATEEDLKALSSPAIRRTFEKQQADIEAAQNEIIKREQITKDYEARVDSWYHENDDKLKKVQNRAITAEAEAAKARAALMEAQRQGMVDVAKDLGYTPDEPKPAVAAVDDRYLTFDKFQQAGKVFAANLTGIFNAASEHARLFPDIPFDADRIRLEADAQGKTFLPYWEEKYKVPAAREAAATKQRETEIAKWKQEGAKEAESKLASLYGNPEMRPLVPSKSPFAPRKEDTLRADNQPWNKSESQLSNDRVQRAAQKLMERQSGGTN